jgi:hypothetical protein
MAGMLRAVICRQCGKRCELMRAPPMACPLCGNTTRGVVSTTDYILDTKVIVDIVTILGLTREAEMRGTLDDPIVQLRQRRACNGLLLAWHFHKEAQPPTPQNHLCAQDFVFDRAPMVRGSSS